MHLRILTVSLSFQVRQAQPGGRLPGALPAGRGHGDHQGQRGQGEQIQVVIHRQIQQKVEQQQKIREGDRGPERGPRDP